MFSKAMIDGIAATLKSFDDRNLRAKVMKSQKAMKALVEEHLYCG